MARFVIVNGFGDAVIAFRGPLVSELVARGHEVIVSTPEPEEVPKERIAGGLAALGARCVFSPLRRTALSIAGERRTAAHYRNLFDETRPDGVFASNPKPVFHAIPAAHAAGVPRRVAMITGLGYAFVSRSVKARLLRLIALRLYRRAMRDATTVLFQNADDRRLFDDAGLVPAGTVVDATGGSGVDLAAFPRRDVPRQARFLMVSRLIGDKGVREFVEAARTVRAQRDDCTFRLVGWADTNPSAIRGDELDAWRREGAVEFAGRLDDVRPELERCSVFVLPSYREGCPRSTLEALATGRAVITTDAPGCRETVEHGVNGLIVPPRDAAAIAGACLRLADDPELRERMGGASRALAERKFDAAAVATRIAAALGA